MQGYVETVLGKSMINNEGFMLSSTKAQPALQSVSAVLPLHFLVSHVAILLVLPPPNRGGEGSRLQFAEAPHHG